MKPSHLCVILLSTLVVQISSETTEVDDIIKKIVSSSFEIAAAPVFDYLKSRPELQNSINDLTKKVRDAMEQAGKDFFNMFPKEERRNREKMFGYLWMYMSGSLSKAGKVVSTVNDKAFDALPDDIKAKILDIGKSINDALTKMKDKNMKNLKTEENDQNNN